MDNQSKTFRPSLRHKFYLGVFATLFGLLLAEIGVRLIIPDTKMGLRAKPNLVMRSTNPAAEFDVGVKINSEGFRDRDHPLTKPADTIRIAFLGDSFVFAQQIEEPDIFVNIVERLLNADP